MYTASKSGMAPLLAVFALGNARIHVCASNSSNVTANVETSVNKHFSIGAILKVLDINCYDLKLKGLSTRTTLVLSNTRELDRVPNTK